MSFWDRLADKSLKEKAQLLAATGDLFRLTFMVDLLAGLVVGVLKGLWDEVVGLIMQPGAGKPDAPDGGTPKKDPKKDKNPEEDDNNEAKVARKASKKAYDNFYGKVKNDLKTASEMKALVKDQDKKIDGVKVAYTLKAARPTGQSWTWDIDAKAGTGTEARTRTSEDGWLAEPSKKVPDSQEMYGGPSAQKDDEKKANDLIDDFETKWQALFDVVEGDEHEDLAAASEDLANAVDSDLMYSDLDVVGIVGEEEQLEDESHVMINAVVAPNTADVEREVKVGSVLDKNLKSITAVPHKALLKRFTVQDWKVAFGIGTDGTAQRQTRKAADSGRLYQVSGGADGVFLLNPIPDGEVPALIVDRVKAEGRGSSILIDKPFGASEIVDFCKADEKVGGVDADWAGGASSALQQLVSEGVIQEVDGKYAFDDKLSGAARWVPQGG